MTDDASAWKYPAWNALLWLLLSQFRRPGHVDDRQQRARGRQRNVRLVQPSDVPEPSVLLGRRGLAARVAAGLAHSRGRFNPPTTSPCGAVSTTPTNVETLLLSQRSADAYLLWRTELRIPFGGSGLGLNVFADVGNLWKDLRNVFSLFSLRLSPGFGLRYITPIGPVGIDVGFAVLPRSFEPPVVFSFSFSSV